MERVARRLVVAVLGSGTDPHEDLAAPLGRLLARGGTHLLTGGGGGVMAAVTRAFCETPGRAGLAIGVLPGVAGLSGTDAPPGYPNPWVELPIRTHLPLSGERGGEPLSRNHINVLSAAACIALPGGAGTASEVLLALAYGRPIVAFVRRREEIPGLPEAVVATADLDEVAAFVRRHVG